LPSSLRIILYFDLCILYLSSCVRLVQLIRGGRRISAPPPPPTSSFFPELWSCYPPLLLSASGALWPSAVYSTPIILPFQVFVDLGTVSFLLGLSDQSVRLLSESSLFYFFLISSVTHICIVTFDFLRNVLLLFLLLFLPSLSLLSPLSGGAKGAGEGLLPEFFTPCFGSPNLATLIFGAFTLFYMHCYVFLFGGCFQAYFYIVFRADLPYTLSWFS